MSDTVGPPPAAPAAPNRVQRAARALRPIDWITAVLIGAGAFVVAYLVAAVSLLLTVAFVVAGAHPTGSSTGSSPGGVDSGAAPSLSGLVTAVTVILGAPAQLVALGDLGRLSIHGSVSVLQTVSGSIHFGFVPVLVLAAQVLALVFGVRLFRARRLDLVQSGIVSVVSGATLAAVTLLVGLVLAIRLPNSSGLNVHGISAVNALAVVAALVVGSCVAIAARPGWLEGLHPVTTRLLGIVRVAAVHLGVILVVIAVAIIVYGAVVRPAGGAAYPLAVANIAVLGAAIGFLGGASLSESAGSLTSTLTNSAAPSGTLTVFSEGSVWLWLLVLLTVITALAAGVALAVRRTSRSRTSIDWVASPLAYAGAGVLLLVFGTVVFSVQIAAVGGSGSAGVTPWTVAVLAVWGVAIEAVARYLAPRVLSVTPPGLVRFTTRLVGVDAAVTAPAGVGSGPVLAAFDPEATSPEAQANAAFAETAPLSPRARKILVRSLVAAGIVVVLIIAGSITASTLRSTVYGPGHAAEAYLDALSRGNATAAGRLSGATGTGKGMMTNAIFGSATNRIGDVAIGKASVSGDLATVPIVYRQGGASHNESLRLTRTGTTWLVHDTWAVSSSLTGKIDVSTDDALGNAAVIVSGKKVGTVSGGELSLTAYPGTYSIAVAGSKYLAAKTQKVTVTAGSLLGKSVQFEATATPQLTTDAEKVVTDLITTCAKSTSGTLPDSCPFYGAGSDTTGVSYTVTRMPTLKVSLGYSGEVEVSGTGGSVEMKYTEDFGDGFTYSGDDTQTIYLDENLKITNGKLVIDNSY